jgi:hypothetical protein
VLAFFLLLFHHYVNELLVRFLALVSPETALPDPHNYLRQRGTRLAENLFDPPELLSQLLQFLKSSSFG